MKLNAQARATTVQMRTVPEELDLQPGDITIGVADAIDHYPWAEVTFAVNGTPWYMSKRVMTSGPVVETKAVSRTTLATVDDGCVCFRCE